MARRRWRNGRNDKNCSLNSDLSSVLSSQYPRYPGYPGVYPTPHPHLSPGYPPHYLHSSMDPMATGHAPHLHHPRLQNGVNYDRQYSAEELGYNIRGNEMGHPHMVTGGYEGLRRHQESQSSEVLSHGHGYEATAPSVSFSAVTLSREQAPTR